MFFIRIDIGNSSRRRQRGEQHPFRPEILPVLQHLQAPQFMRPLAILSQRIFKPQYGDSDQTTSVQQSLTSFRLCCTEEADAEFNGSANIRVGIQFTARISEPRKRE